MNNFYFWICLKVSIYNYNTSIGIFLLSEHCTISSSSLSSETVLCYKINEVGILEIHPLLNMIEHYVLDWVN